MTVERVADGPSPFDRFAREYDEWFTGGGRLVFATEVEAFRRVVQGLPGPWLEIGVGSGRFAEALGIESGIDPSVKLLEMARTRGVGAVLAGGEQQPFRAASFGTAFLIVTLCFLHRPGDVLREAARVVIPDGKVVLGLVLKDSPWGRFYREKGEQGHRFYRHATFYGYDELVALLRVAGFGVERVVSTLLKSPGSVDRKEEPREGYIPDAGFTVVVAAKERRHTDFQARPQDSRDRLLP
ncbi:MAG: class I SAM-dependent methyltransferase [Chloroflexota bacterium]|nr:class I SAM-dependent methyltransferase [Chloroflexota bacterium]